MTDKIFTTYWDELSDGTLDADKLDDTTSTVKFTTAADVSKLAGIEASATADQTAAELLTAIKTVDGTGSLLDADLLDGNEATAFATTAQGSTADSALQPGDIGSTVQAWAAPLDAVSGTNTGDEVPASAIVAGVVELATDAETATGTDATRAVTPAGLASLGIEAGADVTDTTNVTAAGALMDSEVDADIKTLVLPANTTITTFGASLVDDVSAGTARTTLGLVIGTNVQAYDAELAAIAGLVSAADKLPYFTGSGTASLATLTTFIRTLLDDTTAAAARTTLGLGSIATQNGSSVSVTGGSITGITDLAVADGGTGSSTAAGARTNLGVDAAGTDNSTDVTLAGAGTYLSLAGQAITVDPITESDITDLAHTPEGTAVLSTGEVGGTKFLREDGDGTCSWQTPGGGGTVDTSGTPVANDFARFTDADTIEGRSYAETVADLSLEIGTDVQAYSAALDAVSGTNTGDEPAASLTVAGIVELATTAEADTGTSQTLAVTPDALADSKWSQEVFIVAVGDETTAITTGTAKVSFRMPYAATLEDIRASLVTASSSGIPTVDVNEAGTTILSTKLTIDASELTSTTAATAVVISDSALADDALMTIDIDVAGTGAAGLKVAFYWRRT